MCSDVVISVRDVSKCYQIYSSPHDRLKQFIFPRLRNALRLQSRKYYREFWALKGVSFSVAKGETVGLVGRNGSGKSTILQIVCGTLNPSSGEVTTRGRLAALLELGSGFNPEFTGRENIYLNAAVLGLGKAEVDQKIGEIIEFSGVGEFVDQPVKTYSSGMVVRLAFSVAIHVEPEILVVDEALAVGDELFQRKCFSKIESMRAAGTTILFVSHSGAQVIEICDRALLIDDGVKLAEGEPRKIISLYKKLLYAPSDKRDCLRTEILEETDSAPQIDCEMPSLNTVKADFELDHGAEFFDSGLVPVSTIVYESHGALIGSPAIFTLDNRQVNNLIRGQRYKCCYDVAFDQLVMNVRFGMVIKSMSGLPLGGALSAPSLRESISVVERGSNYKVEFEFDCNLNPGTYFMNVGVFGGRSDEETVLHRKADVLAFRVQPILSSIETEMISFGYGVKVSE